MPLAGLAQAMVVRDKKIDPVFCFCDPARGRVAIGQDWPVLPSPQTTTDIHASSRAPSYIQTLAALGFGEPEALAPSLDCWDDIFRVTGAEALVADHAPTALAAAHGRLPSVAMGTGFTLPPSQTPEFPSLRDDRPPPTLHNRFLSAVNHVFAERDVPRLDSLPAVLKADLRGFLSLPHLDPYALFRDDQPLGVAGKRLSPTPADPDGPIFLYTRSDETKLDAVVDGLLATGRPIEAFILGGATPAAALLEQAGANVHLSPSALDELLPRASMVVSHGGAGLTGKALCAGRKQLILPIHLESEITGLRIEAFGTGVSLKAAAPATVTAAIERLSDTSGFQEKADQVAAQIAAMGLPDDPLDHLAEQALAVISQAMP